MYLDLLQICLTSQCRVLDNDFKAESQMRTFLSALALLDFFVYSQLILI